MIYSTEIVKYKDTVKDGQYAHYYFPYVLKETGNYKNALPNGRWMFWDSSGKLLEVKFYRKGIEKKSLNGRQLKSLRLMRVGLSVSVGSQGINCNGLNKAISQETYLHDSFEPANLILSSGIHFGNPSSLTMLLYLKSINNKTSNSYGLFGISKGGILNYTFMQSKNMNYRLGIGLEFPELTFTNFANAFPIPTGPILSNNIIKNKNSMVLDFSFSISPRRLRFRQKTNLDHNSFVSLQIGYVSSIEKGKYFDENGQVLNFDSSLFYMQGFHISLFLTPFLL